MPPRQPTEPVSALGGEAFSMRIRLRIVGVLLAFGVVGLLTVGCATVPGLRAVSDNPLVVPSSDFETVWKASVISVDEYFDIASERREQRKIVTQPKTGATLLEPWEGDSVGFHERLESSLQSIRRFAIITVDPAPNGQGWAIRVEVYKELEDLLQPDRQSLGRAVFNNIQTVNRSREVVGPVQIPAFWIPRGRDTKLEQAIIAKIRTALFL